MKHEHLRAPADHGGVFVRPEIDRLTRTVTDNRKLAERSDFLIAGRPAGELRRQLRGTVLKLAREYTQSLNPRSSLPEVDLEAPLVMTGHQPELYHPGVWFKNHLAAMEIITPALQLVFDTGSENPDYFKGIEEQVNASQQA